ncbi:hypothetical protein ACFUTU_21140 [Arthrobacter sp. NPDC057388]|uniref:hypothetical protein n=1 Tax=Arthrobacter sp. NPDC057388 TaxID=3346116 RepID=UPI003632F6AE
MKKPILTAALLLSLAAGPLASSPALAVGTETAPTVQATDPSTPAAATTGATAETTDPAPATEPATGPVTDPATEPAPDPVTDPAAPEPPSDPSVTEPAVTDPAVTEPPATDPAPDPEPEFTTSGAIGSKYAEMGGAAGKLGSPTAAMVCAAGLCKQHFEGGWIFWTAATGAHPVLADSGRTGPAWHAGGALSTYGFPVQDETPVGTGTIQRFSSGRILTSTSRGIFQIWSKGAIGMRWVERGSESGLGLPTTRETCGLRNGGCSQGFSGGTIYWSPSTGAHIVRGGIAARWAASGSQNGFLGYPRATQVCGQRAGGCLQSFQGGTIYWSPTTGAWTVKGAIGGRYSASGAHRGSLGYPVGSEACGQPASGCIQRFQFGTIYWSPATGAWSSRGAIGSRYAAAGAHRGSLGYPTTDLRCLGAGCAQSFQRGFISWTAPAGSRVYPVTECQKLNNGQSRYSTYGANRVLLTFAQGYGQSRATNLYCVRIAGMYFPDWRTDGYVGASGFKAPGVPSGPTRNLYSPTGSYSVTEAFGLGNPGTRLPYRTLNPRSRWGGNPWTATYNKYFESSSWVGWDENMWYFATRATHDYRQGVVINYNRPNIVQDAGFAIFLHMNKVPTAGCISLDDWAVVDYMRKSTPGDRIIMGTYSALFR